MLPHQLPPQFNNTSVRLSNKEANLADNFIQIFFRCLSSPRDPPLTRSPHRDSPYHQQKPFRRCQKRRQHSLGLLRFGDIYRSRMVPEPVGNQTKTQKEKQITSVSITVHSTAA